MAASALTAAGHARITRPRVVRSEWTKLRSLRSTVWTLGVTAVLIIVPGVLVTMFRAANWPPRDPATIATFDPTASSLTGVLLAQLAIGVLGALVISGEYATGAIRSTFVAVPRRLPVLLAKVAAFALATFAVCLPAVLTAFLAGQSVLAKHHIQARLGDPGVARAVIGSALLLTVTGTLGLALGTLTRNTAAAVAALTGLLFVLPVAASFLPGGLGQTVVKLLPFSAGSAITNVHTDPATSLGAGTGFTLFALYTLVLLALGAARLRRRDA